MGHAEMMERKAPYLCNDVTVLCVDLGNGTDIPDHAQYFIDLRKEGDGIRRGLPSACSQVQPSLPVGHRDQTRHPSATSITPYFSAMPGGQCFWLHGAEQDLSVINKSSTTQEDMIRREKLREAHGWHWL